ncbi:transcriptional regulator [Aquipluma nitroreducens]|uniref:tRNA-dihydrouridine synthase n=1 Tax=Aquipluma nitroreducens TaxID=2010828 RepID=A0A5K7S9B2_9BACT|nr:tRNA-dihydrouridine synthase family protein [Aquipluma nitroreducens]BBE18163.1 transcriptional regulator [Aquipluma nitroreducens]
MSQNAIKIYQAPLQGATDFDFRKALAESFGGIDKYFIPYLSYGKGREIKKSQLREVFPENNESLPVVPQVLFSDHAELFDLVSILIDYGYEEINLNLGCPYPMATNKGRGAAWLEKPEALSEILQQLYAKAFPAKFSVKMRAGMKDDQDAKAIFSVLNQFSLEEIIFHPRTASQMYDGKANPQLFAEAISEVKHPMVYNGDISSAADFQEIQSLLPEQDSWMIGRGLVTNPALAAQLKGEVFEPKALRKQMREFHDQLLEGYSARLQGDGHIVMKMSQFWAYFSQSFENPHKAMKLVTKSSSLLKYNAAVTEIFKNY